MTAGWKAVTQSSLRTESPFSPSPLPPLSVRYFYTDISAISVTFCNSVTQSSLRTESPFSPSPLLSLSLLSTVFSRLSFLLTLFSVCSCEKYQAKTSRPQDSSKILLPKAPLGLSHPSPPSSLPSLSLPLSWSELSIVFSRLSLLFTLFSVCSCEKSKDSS